MRPADPGPSSEIAQGTAEDDGNVGRFCDLIHDLAGRTQFIVVTHIKQTMERSDVLYGVTMEEPGVSKIVTVRLKEGEGVAGRTAEAGAA